MALSNYTELQAAVATWLERDDLTASIVDFIALAETEIRNKVRVHEMITRSDITVNARQISKPTRFADGITLKLKTNPITVLESLSPYEMDRYRRETSGKPKYFTVHTEIEFDRAPDSAYTGEIIYYQYPDALSSTATNDVLSNYPAIYLYGTLKQSAPVLMHDERITVWEALFNQAVTDANLATQRQMKRMGPQVAKVVGRGP
jgi:hypothetical protein